MATRIILNSAGMAQMLRSAPVAAEMARRARNVAAAAQSMAPVETGEYKNSIHVTSETHGDRAVAHVVSDDDKAMVIESRVGVLGRALDSAR